MRKHTHTHTHIHCIGFSIISAGSLQKNLEGLPETPKGHKSLTLQQRDRTFHEPPYLSLTWQQFSKSVICSKKLSLQ